MTGRIRDARVGIAARVEGLTTVPGLHQEEKHALQEALSVLRIVEQHEARFDEEERKRVAAKALRKIEPLASKLRKS